MKTVCIEPAAIVTCDIFGVTVFDRRLLKMPRVVGFEFKWNRCLGAAT